MQLIFDGEINWRRSGVTRTCDSKKSRTLERENFVASITKRWRLTLLFSLLQRIYQHVMLWLLRRIESKRKLQTRIESFLARTVVEWLAQWPSHCDALLRKLRKWVKLSCYISQESFEPVCGPFVGDEKQRNVCENFSLNFFWEKSENNFVTRSNLMQRNKF